MNETYKLILKLSYSRSVGRSYVFAGKKIRFSDFHLLPTMRILSVLIYFPVAGFTLIIQMFESVIAVPALFRSDA